MWKLHKLSLSRQVNQAFALLMAILVTIGALVFLDIRAIEQHISGLTSQILPRLELLEGLNREASLIELDVLRHLLTTDGERKRDYTGKIARDITLNTERLARYGTLINSSRERDIYDQVLAARASYDIRRQEVLELSREGRTQAALASHDTAQSPAYDGYQQGLGKLGDYVEQETRDRGAATVRFIAGTRTVSTLLIVVGLAVGLGMGFVVARISRRLKQEEESLQNEVAERKRAEKALRETLWQLQEQSRLLDLAHVFARNMKDEIIYWNSAAEKLYGWSEEEALGKVTHVQFQTRFPEPPLNEMDGIARCAFMIETKEK